MPAEYHMGCAIAAYLLDRDESAVRRHISLYSVQKGVTLEAAYARMHMRIENVYQFKVKEYAG